MPPSSLPPDESERLRSLRALGLLDTPPEESYDRVTRLAQLLFDVPIALMSLVDEDRQWFKSRQGLDAAETAREISFCSHAIRGDGLFVVPDASRDERFAANPLVVGPPGIRFYAGAPLAAPDGSKIGTLCIIDRRPRELTAAQRTALRDLADLAQDELAQAAARSAAPAPAAPPAVSRVRGRLLAAFGALLAILVAFTTSSYRSTRGFIDDSRAAIRAHEGLEALQSLDSLSKDKEPAERGRRMDVALSVLARLAPDDPVLEEGLSDLREFAGGREVPRLRAAIERLSDLERRRLDDLSESGAARSDRMMDLLLVSGAARAAVVLLALFLLLRGLSARARTEGELRRSRDEALGAAEGRRVAQAESEKLGERLRAVLDHIDIGVVVVELDGSLSVFNLAAERIHRAWREQIERLWRAGAHRPLLEDGATPVAPGEDPLARALKGQMVRDARLFYRTPYRPDGYHVDVSAVPLRSHRGLLTGAVLMFAERPGRERPR